MVDYICCIYAIKNTVNGKLYIGKTRNYKLRKSQHLMLLKNNKHNSHELQIDYNKGDSIEFIIIRLLPNNITDRDLNLAERDEIIKNRTCEIGYNTVLPKKQPLTRKEITMKYIKKSRESLTMLLPIGTKERYREHIAKYYDADTSLTSLYMSLMERDIKEKAGE